MALFKFTKAILADEPIEVFNHGLHTRDFTYVEDIAEAVVRACDRPAASDPAFDGHRPSPCSSSAPWRVYNVGGGRPARLLDYISTLERCLGRAARKIMAPMQPGDIPDTKADTSDLEALLGFRPTAPIEVGVDRFVRWYREYFQV
jgi:UDP-glucuronate 4-epimerase